MTPLVKFQQEVVDGLSAAIVERRPISVSLISPTGSGKTLMLTRAIDQATGDGKPNTIWLWLAPYEVIVAQTAVTIVREARNLVIRSLNRERRNAGFRAGEVFLATSQLIANSSSLVHQRSDHAPTVAEMVMAARRAGFRIGVVLDEAHIGVDAETAFGRRVAGWAPDIILAATATPKDARLSSLLAAAGSPRPLTISVSRQEVVDAGLNKTRLVAMRVLSNGDDSEMAREMAVRGIIHHAVHCRDAIEKVLRRNGSSMVPLLLAQADNRDGSANKIEEALREAGMPQSSIARYLEADKSKGSLSELAADPSVSAIIFKIAAGTGFDAPRACVLASDRAVQDQDTAVQFVGRIMRVPAEIRNLASQGSLTEDDLQQLKTAYLFTRDTGSQEAFRSAATLLRALSTQIDFTVVDLDVLDQYSPNPDGSGGVGEGVARGPSLPGALGTDDHLGPLFDFAGQSTRGVVRFDLRGHPAVGENRNHQEVVGRAASTIPAQSGPNARGYSTDAELNASLLSQGLQCWRLQRREGYPRSFWQEEWPLLEDHSRLMSRLGQAYSPTAKDAEPFVAIARGDWRATARFEDFFASGLYDMDIVISDLNGIARMAERNARQHLSSLRSLADSGAQDELLEIITRKLTRLDLKLTPRELSVLTRLMVPSAMPTIRQAESVFLSRDVKAISGRSLPDLIVVPASINKRESPHSIYGQLPPTEDELQESAPGLAKALAAWHDVDFRVGAEVLRSEKIDQTLSTNQSERLLIDMLDRIDGIRWWARNPDKKSWSARLLRIDGKGRFFYPDFVVNVRTRTPAAMQLVETKHDTLDIEAKRRRGFTPSYGKVLFLFTDGNSLSFVDVNGRPSRRIPANDRSQLLQALEAAAETELSDDIATA